MSRRSWRFCSRVEDILLVQSARPRRCFWPGLSSRPKKAASAQLAMAAVDRIGAPGPVEQLLELWDCGPLETSCSHVSGLPQNFPPSIPTSGALQKCPSSQCSHHLSLRPAPRLLLPETEFGHQEISVSAFGVELLAENQRASSPVRGDFDPC